MKILAGSSNKLLNFHFKGTIAFEAMQNRCLYESLERGEGNYFNVQIGKKNHEIRIYLNTPNHMIALRTSDFSKYPNCLGAVLLKFVSIL